MKKDELISVFPTAVQIYKYENSIDKELNYIENLPYKEQVGNANFKSKDSYLTKHEQLKDLKIFFKECIDDYCNVISNSDQRLVITQLWANKNPTGAKHHEHIHPNSILSGVFYLRQDKTLPPIQFSKSNQQGLKLDPRKYTTHNAETFLLPCTAGELIIFPSDLRHSVPINVGKESRISLSFNTFSVDVLGSEDSLTHLDIRSLMHESN